MAYVQGAYIQAGYPVIADYGAPELDVHASIYGVAFPGGIRRGAVTTVLLYIAGRWHKEIEPLKVGQCWGYDRRDIRGGTGFSNHAGGCAIDINAGNHPQHVYSLGLTAIAAARRIRDDCRGVVGWGGDWTPGSLDQMHWEVAHSMSGSGRVESLARDIAAGRAPNTPPGLITAAQGSRPAPIKGDDMPLSDDDITKVAARIKQPDVGDALALRWFATKLAGTDGTAGAVLANIWGNARTASAAAIKAAAQSAATVPGATAQSVADAVVRTLGEHLT